MEQQVKATVICHELIQELIELVAKGGGESVVLESLKSSLNSVKAEVSLSSREISVLNDDLSPQKEESPGQPQTWEGQDHAKEEPTVQHSTRTRRKWLPACCKMM